MRRFAPLLFAVLLLGLFAEPTRSAQQSAPQSASSKPGRKLKLPKTRPLGSGLELRRDPATGELLAGRSGPGATGAAPGSAAARSAVIHARVNLVGVSCNVVLPDGSHLRGLSRDDFRLFEDGVEQAIAHLDASSEPASIALVLDASPSEFRELAEMKAAARSLAQNLSPLDEVAVVAFAREATLLLPFSRNRALLERAIASPALAQVENSSESNIYLAVYLTAGELFRGRAGRKAILLLTDGQDSGLGLSWDPASSLPRLTGTARPPGGAGVQPGAQADRLAFEDVARELAADGIELYAISTQPRPQAMTAAWLAAHRDAMLITTAARELGMPHYTLYLAELVRRAGGELYFLHEMPTLGDVYRRIAQNLTAQYSLGYYPSAGLARPGWRALRVELRRPVGDARVTHRVAFYVSIAP